MAKVVNRLAEKVRLGLLDAQLVFVEAVEDIGQMQYMLLDQVGEDDNIINVHANEWQVSKNVRHDSLELA